MPLDRVIAEVPVASQDLEAVVRRARRRLGRIELALRRRDAERPPGVGERGGAMDEQARGVELGARLGELPLDHLELGERLAELLALLRVRNGDLEGSAPQADGERSDADAAFVEDLLHV